MSPEQVGGRSKEITPRTDVHALGAILYEAVAGRPPYHGETAPEIYAKIVREEPERPRFWNPAVSRELETILLKALEKDPARRYATALELAEDLRRYLDGKPVLARPATLAYRLYRRVRTNPIVYGLAAAAGAAILVAALMWRVAVVDRTFAVESLRKTAWMTLDFALESRRQGRNDQMRKHLPDLEATHREAAHRAPHLAEVDYLLGRMYRALMENEMALAFQERALRKEPGFAPA
jgi:hypothetical protein